MAMKVKEVVEIIPSKDIFVGNPAATVTLTEFGEYENEDCAKAHEVVKKLLEHFDGKIKFSFRHFPQTKIHQRSMKAAEASLAAGQLGKFWEMHNLLFQNRRQLGTTSLKLYSKEAGVVNKHFLDELINSTYGWQIRNDFQDGVNKGVKEIPAFFVNGEQVEGKQSYENISAAIEYALKHPNKKPTPKVVVKPAPKEEVKVAKKSAVKPAKKTPVKIDKKVSVKVTKKAAAKVAPKSAKKSTAKARA